MASRKRRLASRQPRRDLGSLLVGGAVGAIGASAYAGAHRSKHGLFVLPPDHEPGMHVPKGGSSCYNCKYLYWGDENEPRCWEPNFALWNGSTRLPVDDPREYCSDWWRPAHGAFDRRR